MLGPIFRLWFPLKVFCNLLLHRVNEQLVEVVYSSLSEIFVVNFFFRKLLRLRLICNRNWSSNSVSNRTRDRQIDDFDNHSYDYRPNRTPLGPITIINLKRKKVQSR